MIQFLHESHFHRCHHSSQKIDIAEYHQHTYALVIHVCGRCVARKFFINATEKIPECQQSALYRCPLYSTLQSHGYRYPDTCTNHNPVAESTVQTPEKSNIS